MSMEEERIITIFDAKGSKRFETPINVGSKRVMKLGKDDYALLKFSVYDPVPFAIGDYTDIDGERLYVVAVPQPKYDSNTGGYDYDLQLCPGYKLWANKLLMLNPGGSAEAEFKLTDKIERHLDVVLACINHHGFTYHDENGEERPYRYHVEASGNNDSLFDEALLIAYDSQYILSALDEIAATFECEWWMEKNVIHFGKCEKGAIIEYERDDNVCDVKPSGRDGARKTRLYAFGGTENLPAYYRKRMVFKVTRKEGNYIYDDDHLLRLDMFRSETLKDDPDAAVSLSGLTGSVTLSLENQPAGSVVTVFERTASVKLKGGSWEVNSKGKQLTVTWPEKSPYGNTHTLEAVLSATYTDYTTGEKKTATVTANTNYWASSGIGSTVLTLPKMSFGLPAEGDTVTFAFKVTFKVGDRNTAPEKISFADYTPMSATSLSSFRSAEGLTLIKADGTLIDGAVYNPLHEACETVSVPVSLPTGAILNVGDSFMIEELNRLNIPAAWFTPIDGEPVVDAIASNRLRIPIDYKSYPYIDAVEGLGDSEAVEQVQMFDDIYPKQDNTVSQVWDWEHAETDSDGASRKYHYFFITAGGIDFDEDCIIPGNELRIKFTSGTLNGMTFGAAWRPAGTEGSNRTPCIEIIANEDYGRRLPDTVLKPKEGDGFILLGWSSDRVYDQLVAKAEAELLEKATDWLQEKLTEGETYDCPLIPQYALENGIPELGQRICIKEPSLFPKTDFVSRVIGVEYPLDIPFDNPVVTVGEKIPQSRLDGIERKMRQMGTVSDFSSSSSQSTTVDFGDMLAVIQADLTNQNDSVVFNDLGEIVGGLPETSVVVWVNGVRSDDFTLSIENSYPGLGFSIMGDTVTVTSADLSMQAKYAVEITVTINVNGRQTQRTLPFTVLRRRGDARYNLMPSVSSIRINTDGTVFPKPSDFRCDVLMTGSGEARILTDAQLSEIGLNIEWRADDEDEWSSDKLPYTSENTVVQVRLMLGGECIDLETIPLIQAGVEGKSLDDITNVYLAGLSASEAPQGKWVSDASLSGFSKELPYLWGKEILSYNSGEVKETDPHFMAKWNESADPGRGIRSITEYYLATADERKPSFKVSEWFTDQLECGFGEDLPYLWNVEVIEYTSDPLEETTGPILLSHYGRDGSTPPRAPFQSTVFIRTNEKPAKPTGGTYDEPLPTSKPQWSDGIPAGENILWASTRWFSETEQTEWDEPRQMTDTETYDVEFSDVEVNPGNPTANPGNWFDPDKDKDSKDFTKMIWRAERNKKNGEWSDWVILKIKGEKGEPGKDGQNGQSTYVLDLDNEMAGIPVDHEGKPTGELPSSRATVYVGASVDTGWKFEATASGCSFTINSETGLLQVTGISQDKADIHVTATKEGHASLSATMSLYTVSGGVVFSIEPSVSSVSKSQDGTLSTKSISVTKYVTDGLNPRKETVSHWVRAIVYKNGVAQAENVVAATGVSSGTVNIESDTTAVEFILYDNSSGSTWEKILDRERVPVVADGKDGKDIYLLDLDNEMAGIPVNYLGDPVGTLPESKATVYRGNTVDSGWTFSIECDSCTATVNATTGQIKVTGITGKKASVTVKSTKTGCADLFATMNLYSVEGGVVYSLEPNVNSISKYVDDTLSATSITVTKYVTDGTNPRTEAQYGYLYATQYLNGVAQAQTLIASPSVTKGTVTVNADTTAYEFELRKTPGGDLLDRERVPVVANGKLTEEEKTKIKAELKEDIATGVKDSMVAVLTSTPGDLTLRANAQATVRIATVSDFHRIQSLTHSVPAADSSWLSVSYSVPTPTTAVSVSVTTKNLKPGGATGVIEFTATLTNGTTQKISLPYSTAPQFGFNSSNQLTLNDTPISNSLKGEDGRQGVDGKTYVPSVDDAGNISWNLVDAPTVTPVTKNIKGPAGNDGKTWYPSLDSSGNLSWNQNATSVAPATTNIKGPAGANGSNYTENLVLASEAAFTGLYGTAGAKTLNLSKTLGELAGMKITMSFDYDYSNVTTNSSSYIYYRFLFEIAYVTTDSASTKYFTCALDLTAPASGLSGKGRFSKTFTVPTNLVEGTTGKQRATAYVANEVVSGNCSISKFKLEIGENKDTAWTPNAADLKGANGKGIQVSWNPSSEELTFTPVDNPSTVRISDIASKASLNSQITNVNSQITNVNNNLTSRIDNLRAGATNILMNTKAGISGGWGTDYQEMRDCTTITDSVGSDGFNVTTITRNAVAYSGNPYWYKFIQGFCSYHPRANTFVFSFDYRSTCAAMPWISNRGTNVTKIDGNAKQLPSTGGVWKRGEIVCNWESVTDAYTSLLFGVTLYNVSNGQYFSFRKFKLELGNIGSDWSPAPEDLVATSEFTWKNLQSKPTKVADLGLNDLRISDATIQIGTNSVTALRESDVTITSDSIRIGSKSGTFPSSSSFSSLNSSVQSLITNVANKANISDVESWKIATVDLTNLSSAFYYPVTFQLVDPQKKAKIRVYRGLDASYGVPSYATHANGFVVNCEWETNAGGWGTLTPDRTITAYSCAWANSSILPLGTIGQLTNSSNEYIYLRGGSKYDCKATNCTSIVLRTSTFTVSSQTLSAPISSVDVPVKTLLPRTDFTFPNIGGSISYSDTRITNKPTIPSKLADLSDGASLRTDLANVQTNVSSLQSAVNSKWTKPAKISITNLLPDSFEIISSSYMFSGSLSYDSFAARPIGRVVGGETYSLSIDSTQLVSGSASGLDVCLCRTYGQFVYDEPINFIGGTAFQDPSGFFEISGMSEVMLPIGSFIIVEFEKISFLSTYRTLWLTLYNKTSAALISNVYMSGGQGRGVCTFRLNVQISINNLGVMIGGNITGVNNAQGTINGIKVTFLYASPTSQITGFALSEVMTVTPGLGFATTFTTKATAEAALVFLPNRVGTYNSSNVVKFNKVALVKGDIPVSYTTPFDDIIKSTDVVLSSTGRVQIGSKVATFPTTSQVNAKATLTDVGNAGYAKVVNDATKSPIANFAFSWTGSVLSVCPSPTLSNVGQCYPIGSIASDRRLKENFGIKDFIEVIKRIGDVVTFNYSDRIREIDSSLDTETSHTGLIYQDNMDVGIPSFTVDGPKGYGFINFNSPDYQATLLGAFKQLLKIVEKLMERTNQLESKINQIIKP